MAPRRNEIDMEREIYLKLSQQIEKTIRAIEKKLTDSPEPVVNDYLYRYQAAKALIDAGTAESVTIDDFHKLKHCARGYLETASDWDQEFLREMGETERLLRTG